jgi:mRNA interferase HigB
MKVAGRPKLKEFWNRHSQAKKPLRNWLKVVENARWAKYADVKQTFRSADWFSKDNRDYIIFDVGGNKYRVVTAVNFAGYVVVIKVVMTHPEYDRGKWKQKL